MYILGYANFDFFSSFVTKERQSNLLIWLQRNLILFRETVFFAVRFFPVVPQQYSLAYFWPNSWHTQIWLLLGFQNFLHPYPFILMIMRIILIVQKIPGSKEGADVLVCDYNFCLSHILLFASLKLKKQTLFCFFFKMSISFH